MAYQAVRNQMMPEIKKLNESIEKLQESIEGTDACMLDIYELKEKLAGRINELVEEVTALKSENVDIRDHLRYITKELNAIAHFVNEKHGFKVISETKEIDEPRC